MLLFFWKPGVELLNYIANEIAILREEAQAWKRMRAALRSPNATAARTIFEKVTLSQNDLPTTVSNIEFQAFCLDTEKLLRMEDMWQNRQRPVPLDFDAVSAGTFVLRGEKQTRHVTKTNGSSSNGQASGLRDQRSLTLPESLELFVSR
jgi:ubiquitin-like 1-activating enzyme E1 B